MGRYASQITASEARDIAQRWHIPLDVDFHTLTSEHVASVLGAARERRYHTHPNAPGSTARMFHAYLRRRSTTEV